MPDAPQGPGGFLSGFMSVAKPKIDQAHAEDQAQREMERKFYWDKINDPSLAVDPNDAPEVADNKRRQLQFATDEYNKRSGKVAKGLVGKLTPFLQKIHGHQQQPGMETQGSNAVPPPPTGGASAAPSGAASSAVPPPPGAPAGASPPFPSSGATGTPSAPAVTAQAGQPGGSATSTPPTPALRPVTNADLSATSYQGATTRGLALAKAQATAATDAEVERQKKLAGTAAENAAAEYDKINPNATPQEKQQALSRKLGFVPPPKMITKIVADPDSPTGASNVSYDQLTGQTYAVQPGAFMPRGYIPTETLSNTTDAFGNVTYGVSTRTPIAPGVTTGTGSKPTGAAPAPKTPTSKAAASVTPITSKLPSVPPPLDGDGHIQQISGLNEQVVENANQLLDGQDITKLPQKVRTPAAELARKYGWEQGKFTPKEQTLLRESTTFLQSALNDPALAALDAGFTDRMQLAQVLKNPDKEGFIGGTASTLSAMNLDPQQEAFVRMYNQLVGTISGLGQLVRGGRVTEATIERLKSELPNPTTTKDSADARRRIQRLLKEVDVAMQKGTFEGTGAPSGPAAKPASMAQPGRKSSVPAPPTGQPIIVSPDDMKQAVGAR